MVGKVGNVNGSGTGLTTAAMRAIEALGGGRSGRADQIADLLADAIRLGLIAPGERLPSEAALSQQFGVATLTLREALASLRDRDLVTTTRGRAGGTFVTSRPVDAAPHAVLAGWTVGRLRELGDIRLATAGSAARLAAERASAGDVASLRRRADGFRDAVTPRQRQQADTEFAIAVAVAAQSPRLVQEEAGLRAELGDLLWSPANEGHLAATDASHRALVDAIADRDPHRARELGERQVAAETTLLVNRRIALYTSASAGDWGTVAARFLDVFTWLRRIGRIHAEAFEAKPGGYTRNDIAALRQHITELVEAFADLAMGAGVVLAPGVLEDAPYWLEWWWRRAGESPEALRVNLDPDQPDFFDYPNLDWFSVPVETGRDRVCGPYVDYACTNQYALTLATPVFQPADPSRPLGVVAADIPSEHVERLVMPLLCAEAEPVALANADGRVVASTTALLAGSLLPAAAAARSPRTPGEQQLAEVTGWRLYPLPA